MTGDEGDAKFFRVANRYLDNSERRSKLEESRADMVYRVGPSFTPSFAPSFTPSVASKFEVEDNGRNFIAGCRGSIRRGLIRQRAAVQARRDFLFATRPIHYHSHCCIYVGVFSCLVEQRFRYRTMNAFPWHESSSRNDVDRLTERHVDDASPERPLSLRRRTIPILYAA